MRDGQPSEFGMADDARRTADPAAPSWRHGIFGETVAAEGRIVQRRGHASSCLPAIARRRRVRRSTRRRAAERAGGRREGETTSGPRWGAGGGRVGKVEVGTGKKEGW